MSAKGRFFKLFGGLLTASEVTRVRDLSGGFHFIELQVLPGGRAAWQPGDKVQLLLPSDDTRTYTPIHWGPDGAMALLVYAHGATPAAHWVRQVKAGDELRFAGPSRSLSLAPGPVVLIGDETSLAVAASYARARPGQVRAFVEVSAGAKVDEALRALDLDQVVVVQRQPAAPRGAALVEELPALEGSVGITGNGELIQRVRSALRARGVKNIKVKAYWVEGRAGLD
jgi:NADPH-dependent ferric siderophore reductase